MASIKKGEELTLLSIVMKMTREKKSSVGKHLRLMQKRINGGQKLNTKRMMAHFFPQTSRL